MSVRDLDLVKVWSDGVLIRKNIDFLRNPTKRVTFPISVQIKNIIEDLIDTYRAIPCAGIAANQLGFDKKIFIGMKDDKERMIKDDPSQNIEDVEPDPDNYEIYINPQIDQVNEKSTQKGDEGCLSIPDLSLELERYDEIKVRYYDMDGQRIKKPLSGFLSRLFQHELDHLNGHLMLEHENIYDAGMWAKDDEYKELFMQLMKYLNE